MAKRLFDIFNGFIGSTQVVGAESLSVDQGFDEVAANNDGTIVESARDATRFGAGMQLVCQDILGFDDLISLFESNDTQTVKAEGKEVGSGSGSYLITGNRMKLVSARLSIAAGDNGGYAMANFNFMNSAASGSDTPDDEIAITSITKTITHAAGKRGVRLGGASFTPAGGSAITPLGVIGLDINVQGQAQQTAGDDEFGKTTEVLGYQINGTLSFKDVTLGTGRTVAQRLVAPGSVRYGALVTAYKQQAQGAGSDGTITINNLQFGRETMTVAARQFGGNALTWSSFALLGSTEYKIATGSNKIIVIA